MRKYKGLNESENDSRRLDSMSLELPPLSSDNPLSTKHANSIAVNIKISDAEVRKIYVHLGSELVINLKRKAFPEEILEGKRVRLIYQGRIMLDEHPLSKFSDKYTDLSDDCFMHGIISDPPIEVEPIIPQGNGFTRLEAAGFTQEEIYELSFHFHAMCIYSGFNIYSEEERKAHEDRWIDGNLSIINSPPDERTVRMLELV